MSMYICNFFPFYLFPLNLTFLTKYLAVCFQTAYPGIYIYIALSLIPVIPFGPEVNFLFQVKWSGVRTQHSTTPFIDDMYDRLKETLNDYEVIICRWPEYTFVLENVCGKIYILFQLCLIQIIRYVVP